MRSAPAISFEPRRSRLLLIALLIMGLLSLLAIATCAVPIWLKLLMGAAMLSGVLRAAGALRQPAWHRISHDQAGWTLGNENGSAVPASLHQHARLGNLITMQFQLPDRRWHCLLAPDAMDADTRRRLLLTLASLQDPADAAATLP